MAAEKSQTISPSSLDQKVHCRVVRAIITPNLTVCAALILDRRELNIRAAGSSGRTPEEAIANAVQRIYRLGNPELFEVAVSSWEADGKPIETIGLVPEEKEQEFYDLD